MGGMIDLRDNLLPGYMRELDQLAAGVVQQVNTLHAAGTGLNTGTTGWQFFVGNNFDTTLQTGNDALGLPLDNGLGDPIDFAHDYAGMVRNLNINQVIVENPRYVSSADALGEPGNNEIARKLAELQTKDGTVIVRDRVSGLPIYKGPFSTYISSVANEVGNLALKLRNSANTDENIRVALEIQRDRLSAVDMDEEATNLIVFQRSYQACSRFISVINQLTDQLVNNFGR
jgi:flagellar hook-associated protein 1 FlgK